jgi:dolichyl-diphosphooligosaccharide--protein glycosyltransferase/undecaprenyl-diphosphooligosaccharide--protein glycosyltransferase
MNILPTVAVFSNLDLVSGRQYAQPFFYMSRSFRDQGNLLNLGNNIIVDKNKSIVQLGNQRVALKRFVEVSYTKDNKLHKKVQKLNENGPLSLIYMPTYGLFLLMDEKMYNSLYIKLFVLEEYDPTLFEPVILSPYAKVYRLKK